MFFLGFHLIFSATILLRFSKVNAANPSLCVKVVDLSVAIYLLKSRLVLRCITELRPKRSLN